MHRFFLLPFASLVVVAAVACRTNGTQSATADAAVTKLVRTSYSVTSDAPPLFEQELLHAARDYKNWARVSDRANWAPTDCRAPKRAAGVQLSDSDDDGTHGRKLYFLFASKPNEYLALDFFESHDDAQRATARNALIGEVIVKESWQSIEVDPTQIPRFLKHPPSSIVCAFPAPPDRTPTVPPRTETNADNLYLPDLPVDYVRDGDKAYRTGRRTALFIMLKLDPATPNTDEGWVYGTVTPDAKTVTSSGRVASCMKCHVDAPRDRLHGLFPPLK